MDSSRSGLLSTLLMTLPLIVVPAIALLRPPGQAAGVSTSPLDASDSSDDDFLSDLMELEAGLDDAPEFIGKPSSQSSTEFDGLFEETEDETPDAGTTKADDRNHRPNGTKPAGEPNPFMPFEPGENDRSAVDPRTVQRSPGTADEIVEYLNSHGALKTMWFEAGPKSPVGFATFFRGQTELMRIRFEAVGQTREECARNVFDQVTQWQAKESAESR